MGSMRPHFVDIVYRLPALGCLQTVDAVDPNFSYRCVDDILPLVIPMADVKSGVYLDTDGSEGTNGCLFLRKPSGGVTWASAYTGCQDFPKGRLLTAVRVLLCFCALYLVEAPLNRKA